MTALPQTVVSQPQRLRDHLLTATVVFIAPAAVIGAVVGTVVGTLGLAG